MSTFEGNYSRLIGHKFDGEDEIQALLKTTYGTFSRTEKYSNPPKSQEIALIMTKLIARIKTKRNLKSFWST